MEEKVNQEINKSLTTSQLRISNYTTGQRWVTLHGDFTSTELYEIADQIEKSYNKAFKK